MSDPQSARYGPARDAIAMAYDRYAAGLYRHALMITADPSLAEDAVHQAFAKLAGMPGRIGDLQSVESYLRTAVRHEAYRLLAARPDAHEFPDLPALLEPVDAILTSGEEHLQVEMALQKLPAEQRELVHLKIYEELTFQQIAEALAIPLNTAASRYRYAIEKLRDLLVCLKKEDV